MWQTMCTWRCECMWGCDSAGTHEHVSVSNPRESMHVWEWVHVRVNAFMTVSLYTWVHVLYVHEDMMTNAPVRIWVYMHVTWYMPVACKVLGDAYVNICLCHCAVGTWCAGHVYVWVGMAETHRESQASLGAICLLRKSLESVVVDGDGLSRGEEWDKVSSTSTWELTVGGMGFWAVWAL